MLYLPHQLNTILSSGALYGKYLSRYLFENVLMSVSDIISVKFAI